MSTLKSFNTQEKFVALNKQLKDEAAAVRHVQLQLVELTEATTASIAAAHQQQVRRASQRCANAKTPAPFVAGTLLATAEAFAAAAAAAAAATAATAGGGGGGGGATAGKEGRSQRRRRRLRALRRRRLLVRVFVCARRVRRFVRRPPAHGRSIDRD